MLRRAKDQGRFRGLLRPERRVGYRRVIFVQIRMKMKHRQHSTYRHRKKDLQMTRSCNSVSSQTVYLILSSNHLVVPRELPVLPLLPDLAPPDDPEELPELPELPEDEPDEPDELDDERPPPPPPLDPPLDPPPPLLFSR